MCMSVKKIEERISTAKNEVLEKKLQKVANIEKVDNYALSMVEDNYGYGFIYAISEFVLGIVKLQERWCEFTKKQMQAEAYSV